MMIIKIDLRNSFSRDGCYEVSSYEEALRIAKDYVSEKSKAGKCAYAEILWYVESGRVGNRYLSASITVSSKATGRFYSNGYAIPEPEGFCKSLYVSMNKGCNIVERIYRELDMEEK